MEVQQLALDRAVPCQHGKQAPTRQRRDGDALASIGNATAGQLQDRGNEVDHVPHVVKFASRPQRGSGLRGGGFRVTE